MENELISICILSYNQENFIEEAIDGALSQDYECCEIIISDDCSKDKTFERIKNKVNQYKGNKSIRINCNEQNLGLVKHINKITTEFVQGQYIMLCGGDDISLPNRASDAIKCFRQNPSATAVTGGAIHINTNGIEIGRGSVPSNTETSIKDKSFLCSPSLMSGLVGLTIHRKVIEIFGPLQETAQTEDSCYRFRSLILGNMITLSNFILKYRHHGNNISAASNIFNLKTDGIVKQYLADIYTAKEKNIIDLDLYNVLLKKIDYYQKNRNLDEKIYKNKIFSSYYKLVKRLFSINYKRYISKTIKS